MRTISSALMAAMGLLLVGCQSDAPTGAAATTPTTFALTPGAAHATTTNRVTKELPTVQVWEASQAAQQGASVKTVNSPFDLTYFGGPVVTQATEWNVYTNCPAGPASCWGTGSLTPATVMRDLNASNILQVANQFIGAEADGHFHVKELSTTFTFSGAPTATAPGGTASLTDIFEIVASAAFATGANGYGHEFHVFLPNGTDMCMAAGDCYSPDIPSTFRFCAFHGSVDVAFSATEIVHLIYSVQPYQFVPGCPLPAQTRVIDATASSLAHEFMESITDPDLDAWFNALLGDEIGDLCFGFRHNSQVGAHVYAIQEMYSNANHACTDNTNNIF
jgi:hypothetical protein